MRGDSFDAVRDAIAESLVGRVARGAADAWSAALAESRMALAVRRFVERIGRWSSVDRLQCAASVVAGTSMGNLVLRPLTPVYVASAVPWWVWAIVAVAGFVLAAGARHFVAAWPESTLARLAPNRLLKKPAT